MVKNCWKTAIACAVLVYAGQKSIAESPFSEMVVFGASFDDPTTRFTNGPLWNEWLASELDMKAPLASRSGGTNYSVSGQTTSQLKSQVRQYLRDHTPDATTLLTFSFGAMGNDFRVNRRMDPTISAGNMADMVSQLADAGGQFFMVPTAAQAGLSPINRSQADAWEAFFVDYDAALEPLLDDLKANRDLVIYRPDIFGLTTGANENPSVYGFTHVTGRADQGVQTPHEYMWWDNWHPTTAMHRLAGHEAFKSMGLSVEPDAISLGRSQMTYQQDFEELTSGRINTRLPVGWIGVTDGAHYTSITGQVPSRIGAGGSLYRRGPSDDRMLAMGITDHTRQTEIQLLANVTDQDLHAFRLEFDMEAWAFSSALAVEPGESAYDIHIEADTGQGFVSVADFALTSGAVLPLPDRGSKVDGNADPYRTSFDSGVQQTSLPAGSKLRVRWTVPNESQTTGWVYGLDNVVLSVAETFLPGDFDLDGVLGVADIDLISRKVRAETFLSNYDLNADAMIDQEDRGVWVKELKHTYFGDANLDGRFNTADLVAVFKAGEYEDGDALNSTWATGDWNGDGEFDTGDLVIAFKDGGFEKGPIAPVSSVPEPTTVLVLAAGLIGIAVRSRRAGS